MILFLVSTAFMLGMSAYDSYEWRYVGYTECERVGFVEPEKATVYPAHDKHQKPYILFKQRNKDGTYTVACKHK